MEKLEVLITREQIREKVAKLAAQLREDYHNKNPVLVGILKGNFVFMSDLIRNLDMPLRIDFMSVSSYGREMESSGEIELLQDLKSPIEGMYVLVVEDIVDTGMCLSYVLDILNQKKPASVKVCTLLDKSSRRKKPVNIDYTGFTIPEKFVVGYGLDFNEQYRHLPDVCFLDTESQS